MTPENERLMRLNIALIRERTRRHEELGKSHHFLYDLRIPSDREAAFVIMGINPGESPRLCANHPGPCEETSISDWFTAAGHDRAALRWSKACANYLDGAPYVLTELFFWSSQNLAQLNDRLGHRWDLSPHLGFCHERNGELIAAHNPYAVIVVGFSAERFCRTGYELTLVDRITDGDNRVADRYLDPTGRNWLITKHWTGSRKFTTAQRDMIRKAVRDLRS